MESDRTVEAEHQGVASMGARFRRGMPAPETRFEA
jgi:hypothetical protein